MLDGFLTVGELAKELGIPVWKTRRVADALFKDGIPRVGQRRGRLRPAIRDQARDRRINELLGPRMQNSSMIEFCTERLADMNEKKNPASMAAARDPNGNVNAVKEGEP